MSDLAYEHNGARIGRAAFYAIACDPARSVAVEACAGAGKTWMLVSRILRALLDGCPAHEILAITFTKKAAGEMRQRLQEWLAEFAHASPEVLEQELKARGVVQAAAEGARVQLQNLYRVILEAGRPVQIRTFHSWFAALLRTAPVSVLHILGLPVSYELLEDDTEAVAQVWRRFYAALLSQPERHQDFLDVVARHGRFQTHKALEAALSKRVEFNLADAHGVVDLSIKTFAEQFPHFDGLDLPEDLLRQAEGRAQMLAAAAALGRASAATFSAKGVELEQAVSAGNAPAVLAALLTQKGEPRKFSDKLSGIESVRAAQELVLRVVAANEQHSAWLHQQAMARLTRVLVAEFSALKRERGWVDMNDVERAALTMLSDPVLSGWVQQRLDARVRHLLIDEFQDTNPLQWQALHAWLSSYAGAGGGAGAAPSVFIVGDPKQSIYRFRRAEPQVFRAAQAFVVQGLGGDLLSCDHTRRNAPEVVAAVNGVMGQAQDSGAYEGFRSHTTESVQAGAVVALPPIPRELVQMHVETAEAAAYQPLWRDSLVTPRELPEETLRNLECRQAARWLARQLSSGLRPQDIMVLARRRDRLAAMQDELRALHIPAQQPEKADLGEAPEVRDVVALLDALVSPTHDLSLARALRSPLFSLDDRELVDIALAQRLSRQAAGSAREPAASWLDLLQAQASVALPARLRDIGEVLRRWQEWLNSLPPHDALAAIFHDGDVVAKFAQAAPPAMRASVVTNLRAMLFATLQLDGARYSTPYAVVRAFKRGGLKAPDSRQVEAVRLLTVHGAKGLEAPLVLMLDTDTMPARAETMGVLVEWPGEAHAPTRFAFIASESRPPACTALALAAEQTARQREELNALYVAMTRARQRLVVSSVEPHRRSETSWRQRLAPWCAALPVAVEEVTLPFDVDTSASDGAAFSILVVPAHALVESAPVATPAPAPMDSLASRIGQAMHRLLEWGHTLAQPEFEQLQTAVAREFTLEPVHVRQAQQMAQNILGGEGAWAWHAPELDWHGNEVELLHRGARLRMDRLVRRRDTGEWWVLDYKSAAHPQQQAPLVAQMHAYRAAVLAAHEGAVVRLAFLTAHGALVEITGSD
jgi:ATP-dependent helicase/nuclease subunit A